MWMGKSGNTTVALVTVPVLPSAKSAVITSDEVGKAPPAFNNTIPVPSLPFLHDHRQDGTTLPCMRLSDMHLINVHAELLPNGNYSLWYGTRWGIGNVRAVRLMVNGKYFCFCMIMF